MSIYKMWESAKRPPEWGRWEEFRAWCIANRYKAEYGYKGEFAPENLLIAIPGNEPSEPELNFNSLMRLKLDDLKQIALEKGIESGETKREIASLIIGGE